jgi:hypothetical protein
MASTRIRPTGARPVKLTPSTVKAPTLRGDIEWHPATRRIWRTWWASPMANEWGEDIEGLSGLILLVNDLQTAKSGRERAALATEIRLQRDAYGLTPASRRKLGWQLPGEDDSDATRTRRAPATTTADLDVSRPTSRARKRPARKSSGGVEYAPAGAIGVLPE